MALDRPIENQTILLTGGTGSFGQAFTRLVLDKHQPKAMRIYSRDELKQSEMMARFRDDRLRFLIGDIRDRDRLRRAMEGVDVVVHAAALKQIPSAEYNPIEAVNTNINGTANVIDAAIDTRVKRVLAISTDKSVHPVNLYGATKMVMEKLMIQSNAYAAYAGTRFACVRYGNVHGSRGSVIAVWREQRKSGKITLTHPDMTRFWFTVDEGAEFVVRSLARMTGGEIFVPKIPSLKILDLAQMAAPGCETEMIGIRAGEKLHEELISEDEAPNTVEFDDSFLIQPQFVWWDREQVVGGKPVGAGISYTSDNNDWWLTRKEIEALVRE